MNTVLHPVGPQPTRVYWVRRLVLLVLVAVLVTVLAFALGAARGDATDGTGAAASGTDGAGEAGGAPVADAGADGAEDGTEGATGDEAEDAADDDGTGAAAACAPQALTTTLAADAASYAPGATPTFTVTLTNTGDSACTVDAGLANQALVITSGADRVWSSADCPSEASGERLLLMAPGAAEAMPVAWPRVRSAEGCPGDLPQPRPGTYTAVAVVAGVQSGQVVFELG